MSIRDHRDRAVGKRYINRMPKVSDIKMGTKIVNDAKIDIPEPEQCAGCGQWFSTDDLDHGYCGNCTPNPSGNAESENNESCNDETIEFMDDEPNFGYDSSED